MEESSINEDSICDESSNAIESAMELTEVTECSNANLDWKSSKLSITLTTEEQELLNKGLAEVTADISTTSDIPMEECTENSVTQNAPADDSELTIPVYSEFLRNPLIEIGRRLFESTADKQQYTKGCAWSPDGTCLLLCVQFNGMHVVELPQDLYQCTDLSDERPLSSLPTEVFVNEGGTVYDFSWYPQMNSSNPATCCWLATRQHEPIHMWDAFNGELRCSYRGYDAVDEVETAISVGFSCDGDKVFGGYKKSIKVFDTVIPGRDCTCIPVKKAISCFGVNSGSPHTITAGTWNGYIQLYDLRSPKLGSLSTLRGHNGGITWLRYLQDEALDNTLLLSGSRKEGHLLLWDMRNFAKPLRDFTRVVTTNQRIYYDVDWTQQWLVSGGTDGILRAWDITDENSTVQMIPLHTDCCNGVSFHPSRPILATTSGQYHFTGAADTTKADNDEVVIDYENSLMMLWYGKNTAKRDCLS